MGLVSQMCSVPHWGSVTDHEGIAMSSVDILEMYEEDMTASVSTSFDEPG